VSLHVVSGIDRRALRDAAVAAVFIACLLAVAFPGVFLRGEVLFSRDLHAIGYSQSESFVRAVSSGAWPVWDPWVGFGRPLWATPDAEVLYPPHWANLLMRPWTYHTGFALAHILFSALGVFTLSRSLGMGRLAAGLASAAWAVSGPLLSLANLWHHLAGAAWIPWVWVAARRSLGDPSLRRVCVWSLAQAAQVLAGSAEMCLMTLVLVAADALPRLSLRTPLRAESRRLARNACLAGILAVGVTAALWLPALELASPSMRRHLDDSVRTAWSLHPLLAAQIALPVFLQELPLDPTVRVTLYEGRQPFLASVYLGLPVLGFAAVGLVGAPRSVRRGPVLVAGLALLLALGRHAPFHGALLHVFPPLAFIRYPVKAMVLVALVCAILAGFGLDATMRGAPKRRGLLAGVFAVATVVPFATLLVGRAWASVWTPYLLRVAPAEVPEAVAPLAHGLAWATGVGALCLLASLACLRRPSRAIGAGFVVLAALDLGLVHHRVNPTTPTALLTFRPPLVDASRPREGRRLFVYDYLSDIHKTQRLLGREDGYAIERPPEGWPLARIQVLALRLGLIPPVGAQWGIEGSYERDVRALGTPEMTGVLQLLTAVEGTPKYLRLLRLGAVDTVVARHREGLDGLSEVAVIASLFEQPFRVLRVPSPLPRCYAVGGARVAVGDEALRLLVDDSFVPEREVVISEGPGQDAPSGFRGSARLVDLRPDRVVLEAEMSHPGLVVLVDAFAPGWRASVDGASAATLRANTVFRAVRVPQGRHRIELVYRPVGVVAGLGVSALGALALLATGLHGRRQDRRGRRPGVGGPET
jgi:hypothetical protein